MDMSTEAIASSAPFRFLVGPNKKEFTIHSALVAQQSPVLSRLVNGEFREASDKCVKWGSVDEDTFLRFWQYVYSRDYDAAAPEIISKSTSKGVDELSESSTDSEVDNAASIFNAQAHPWNKPSPKSLTRRESQWNKFQELRYHPSQVLFIFVPRKNTSALEDYTNVFLCHARLYVFAECYGIDRLMWLSLYRLHQTLVTFTLFKERVNDIVALVDYCYRELVPKILRELVIKYMACKVEELWKSEKFKELVEVHGELPRDLIGAMLVRLD